MEKKIHIPMKGVVLAPGLLPGVKAEDLKKIHCNHCGPEFNKFIQISTLGWATQFQTMKGKPMLINFQSGWACVKCGQVNNFEIPGVTDNKETDPNLN